MAEIHVEIEIAASPTEVWADLCQIASHVEWMHDAKSITFTSANREGVGTTFDCATKVGPLRLTDKMEITEWIPEQTMGVRHVGLVEGTGRFSLSPIGDDRTLFSWTETLAFPRLIGGRLGGLIGGRILRAIWRRNLTLLAARFD